MSVLQFCNYLLSIKHGVIDKVDIQCKEMGYHSTLLRIAIMQVNY